MSSRNPVRPSTSTRKPATIEPELEPLPIDMRAQLAEALDYLDGAREALEELTFNADDATSDRRLLTRKSLRTSAFEYSFEAVKCLRFAQRAIEAVDGRLARRT